MPGRTGASLQGLIDRHDLIAALDRAATKQVTIVSAPAGSGKTSLLRSWSEHTGSRTAYLSIRPDQYDAQLFWLALLAAVRAATGSAEPPPRPPGFDGPAAIRSELAAADDEFILIIDDLHELNSAEAIPQLTTLLTTLPAGVHAVVATRGESRLRLQRLRLAGELSEIRGAQLPFTEDETRELLATAGVTISDRAVAVLQERTEGWAAGLRLAILSLAGHPDPERFVAEFSGTDRTVAEYLLAEMLDHQPPEVQRLLLRTSVLDRVNGELADLLTGTTGSERILLALEDANAFVVSLDHERTWFRYHHLFRDLLRLELRRTDDVHELHRVAARWFADHADVAESTRHLQASGDWTAAAQMLTDHALSLTLDGQAATVAALLHSFPHGVRGLALAHAVAELNRGRPDEAVAHLEVARADLADAPVDHRHRLRTTIAALDLLAARLRGHFDGIIERVEALPSTTSMSSADVVLSNDAHATALLNLGVTAAWSLRLSDSEKYLLQGAEVAREIGRPYLEVACLAHLGFTATRDASARARRYCEDAIEQATRYGWAAEPVIAPAYITLAGVLSWTGDFDQAEEWLARARNAVPSGGEPGTQLLLHLAAATLSAGRGRHEDTLAELVAAGQVRMAGRHALIGRVLGWTIETQVRLGQLAEARAAVAAVDDHLASTGELRNAVAVLHLAEQQPAEARAELRSVLDGTAPRNPVLTLIEANLLDALAARALGDDESARASAERALHLAEPDRILLPFVMTGAAPLLAGLPTHGTTHAALVTDILDATSTHSAAPAPAEALSKSELRVLRYLPTNLTRPEIAGKLSVSLNTVNTHIRHIYIKLGATDRSAAVQRARELRLLSAGRA
ncbi:LuxR family maltose regulon positive regulatory protein [Kribbella steppae]|uniref:LuxR family maltose regulon positive regulatory protein n=1 Tax=Kribbella steppae TaxID=2512223 RepID=A0A4V2RYG8_9ACTN|nr:LuxR C-terminal-related transcriptional regulator [Kribbella steppae]TCO19667.1 LuxR family maltose regulon positive regulatory protein [Kribbella steppae]